MAAVPAARSQLREWGRLLGILLLVLSPSIVIAIALEGLAWRVGETMPVSWASVWQDAAPDRIWRGGDGHSFLNYKVARVRDVKPEILALGPARANQFRADAFAPYKFYNASLAAFTFQQYRHFLELVCRDGYAPRVLVFNLDYWMFSSGFDHYFVDRFDEHAASHVADLLRVIAQLSDDPMRLWRGMPRADHVHGLYAILTGDGFNPDGSMIAPTASPDRQRLLDDGTEPGAPPAVLGERMAAEQVTEFKRLIALAREKHVALVGVQMPLYEKILNGLNGNPEAGIWREFASPEWRQGMEAEGVTFFDFADMPEYRDKPERFVTSLEPDAMAAGQLARRIMTDPRVQALLPKPAGGAAR